MGDEPDTFSPAGAKLAAEQLFEAIPKTRRMDYIGAYNEVLVTIECLAVGKDPNKSVAWASAASWQGSSDSAIPATRRSARRSSPRSRASTRRTNAAST